MNPKKNSQKKILKFFSALLTPGVWHENSRFPSRSVSTNESGITRKKRQVPWLDLSQSSALITASRAMIRNGAISSLKSVPSCCKLARIFGANRTRVNVTGIFETIVISKIRSGPLWASG